MVKWYGNVGSNGVIYIVPRSKILLYLLFQASNNPDDNDPMLSCPWLTRPIVRPLSAAIITRMTDQMRDLGDAETQEWILEFERRAVVPETDFVEELVTLIFVTLVCISHSR